ncbi:MAG: hypothetical protein JNM27_04525 [Leptospirales bacterium]|nr:hypothetical protein [Leptospirales bacterium]
MKLKLVLPALSIFVFCAVAAAPKKSPRVIDDAIHRKPGERALVNWPLGSIIHVYFMNGTAAKRTQFAECTSEWSKYGNFLIQYHQEPMPNGVYAVLVEFVGGGGGMSHVGYGTYNNQIPSIRVNAQPGECTAFTHEFGHTLGLEHEFENPDGLKYITVNENTYRLLEEYFGWDRATADAKLLKKKAKPGQEKPFDPHSIMGYSSNLFPELFNGVNMQPGNRLSQGDKAYIAKLYPGKTSQTILPFAFNDDHLAPVEATKTASWPEQKMTMTVPASFMVQSSNSSRFAMSNPSFSHQFYMVPGLINNDAQRLASGLAINSTFLNGLPLTNIQAGWSGSHSNSEMPYTWSFQSFTAAGVDQKGQPTIYALTIVEFEFRNGQGYTGYALHKADDTLKAQFDVWSNSLLLGATPVTPAPVNNPITPVTPVTPATEQSDLNNPCPYKEYGWCKDVKNGVVEHRGTTYRLPPGISQAIALPDSDQLTFDFEAPDESWQSASAKFQKFYVGTTMNGVTIAPFVSHKDGYLVSRNCGQDKRGVQITIYSNLVPRWYALTLKPVCD